MALTNKWTNPLRRSFQDIKNDMLDALKKLTDTKGQPLITDISEGNILVLIISLFAAIAETLHFYIDNMARECFIGTSRRYSSVTQIGLLVDYHAHGANAATTDIVLTRELNGESTPASITISEGTSFIDSKGNTWLVSKDIVWGANSTTCIVPLKQHERYLNSILNGAVIDSEYATLSLDSSSLGGKYIEHGTVKLTIGSEPWVQVETFAYSGPNDKHFMVVVDESDIPVIKFGDGKFGKRPTVGSRITNVEFYITAGSSGNVYSNSITNVPGILSSQGVTCNNPYPSGDGMDYEDIELLRKHVSLHARTMGMAITKQDFIDCAMLYPGVGDVGMEYICGRKINLYISPYNGGIAGSDLIKGVNEYLKNHAPMTTWLKVFSAGIANLVLGIEVTGKPSFQSDQIQRSIEKALYNEFSSRKGKIGGSVRISDIYALIDNLPEVDYLYIKKFFISPWPRIIYGDTQLDLTLTRINKAKGSMKYIISFNGSSTFSIYSYDNRFELKDNNVSGTTDNTGITVDDTINGFNFSIIVRGNYGQGYKYEITISEPNMDYEEPGFNQIEFDPNLLTLDINETV